MKEIQGIKVSDTAKDLTGMRFGKLVVTKPSNVRGSQRELQWWCKCDCGRTAYVVSRNLIGGRTKSCGCGILKKYRKRHYYEDYK